MKARFYFTSITFVVFAILTVLFLTYLILLSPNEVIQSWGFLEVLILWLGIIAGPLSPVIFTGDWFYFSHNLLLKTIINFTVIMADIFYPSLISKIVTFMAIFFWYLQGLAYTFSGV